MLERDKLVSMSKTTTNLPKLATLSTIGAAARIATHGYDRVQAVVLGPVGTVWVTTWRVARELEHLGYEVLSPMDALAAAGV